MATIEGEPQFEIEMESNIFDRDDDAKECRDKWDTNRLIVTNWNISELLNSAKYSLSNCLR